MEKAIDRILREVEKRGLKVSFVERELSMSNGYLANMHKKHGNLGEEAIVKLADYLDLTLDYILRGSSKEEKQQRTIQDASENTEMELRRLPLIPISAMAGASTGDISVLELDCEQYYIPDFDKKADYLIRLSGNSMSPRYNNGDIVACKRLPSNSFMQWGQVYILDTEQGALCKRIYPSEKGEEFIKIVSDNKDYPPFDMATSQVRAMALVVGAIALE